MLSPPIHYSVKQSLDMDLNLIDYYISAGDHKVLMYFKGSFDELMLAKMSKFLRDRFPETPRAGKKVFAVFMEVAENISHYSSETSSFDEGRQRGIGTILIHEGDEFYHLTAGNLITSAAAEEIQTKCAHINELDVDALRELKRETLGQPREEGQRGGHIGLIQVAIKSENPINFELHKVNDRFSFFVLSAKVKKNLD